MKIILDAMGGDNAPLAPIEGAILAAKEYGVEIVLVGQEERIRQTIAEHKLELPAGITIHHAGEVIEMCDDPAKAWRQKKDSSMTVGLTMVKNGEGDAFVCAGSTGALLSGATLVTKRIKGIRRAAMAPIIPTGHGGSVLLDCGANAECPPEYLLQFAYMGSYYAEKALGRANPTVALLNIGVEPSKGTTLQTTVYPMLQEAAAAGRINFVGNIEAREAIEGAVDVIVCDGYSGNIMIKAMEGTGKVMSREMKKMFKKNIFTMLAAAMVSGGIKELKKMMSSDEIGGTALLGISRPVIKAHGSSNGYAIKHAIRQARDFAASGIIDDITANVDVMRLKQTGGEEE